VLLMIGWVYISDILDINVQHNMIKFAIRILLAARAAGCANFCRGLSALVILLSPGYLSLTHWHL
jgi:hypothetical protein